MNELSDQIPIILNLNNNFYSKNMRKKYGNSVECIITSMFGIKDNDIFYEGIILESNEEIYIPYKYILKSNNSLINEDIQNFKNIKFKYFQKIYVGKLANIENDVYNIIGEDGLLYRIRKENIINEN